MASKTKRLETVRARKRSQKGKKAKAARRTQGSTKSPKVLFKD
jgi:hypothetical protein